MEVPGRFLLDCGGRFTGFASENPGRTFRRSETRLFVGLASVRYPGVRVRWEDKKEGALPELATRPFVRPSGSVAAGRITQRRRPVLRIRPHQHLGR